MSEVVKEQENNVRVIARRYRVNHKGLHGFIEYLPKTKLWQWTLKLIFSTTQSSIENTKEQAELELKREIEVVADSKHVRSTD